MIDGDAAQLRLWTDYLESLDVAVTLPFYTYNQAKPVRGLMPITSDAPFTGHYDAGDGCREHFLSTDDPGQSAWTISAVSDEDFGKDVASRSAFHLFASIPCARLVELAGSGAWEPVVCDEGVGSTLASQPLLPDALYVGNRWDAASLTTYNSRLMIAPSRRLLPRPLPFKAMTCHTVSVTGDSRRVSVATDYHINGADYGAVASSRAAGIPAELFSVGDLLTHFPRWVYVPDPDARQLTLVSGEWAVDSDKAVRITLPLRRHPSMNGAYWWAGRPTSFQPPHTPEGEPVEPPVAAGPSTVECGAMMLTSEPYCPMAFAVGSSVTLPGRRIMALRAALHPMSQGQFGDYPLYVFTDCGVSALQVDASERGAWDSQRLVTPLGLVAPEAVTALDNGVAYISPGGVMLLTGSAARRIDVRLSELHHATPTPQQLPHIAEIARWAGHPGAIDEVSIHHLDRPAAYALAYDPRWHLLLMWRKGSSAYCHAYSPDYDSWAMMQQSVPWRGAVTTAEGADQPLLLTDGTVMRLTDATPESAMLIISSPTIADGNRRWRYGEIMIAGTQPQGPESITVYGSNDLATWHPIRSAIASHLPPMTTGTPRRAYLTVTVARRPRIESTLQ